MRKLTEIKNNATKNFNAGAIIATPKTTHWAKITRRPTNNV